MSSKCFIWTNILVVNSHFRLRYQLLTLDFPCKISSKIFKPTEGKYGKCGFKRDFLRHPQEKKRWIGRIYLYSSCRQYFKAQRKKTYFISEISLKLPFYNIEHIEKIWNDLGLKIFILVYDVSNGDINGFQ